MSLWSLLLAFVGLLALDDPFPPPTPRPSPSPSPSPRPSPD